MSDVPRTRSDGLGFIAPDSSWERITLRGGSHDGTICWAQRPPRRLSIVEGGDEYVCVGAGLYVWHEPGRPEPEGRELAGGASQMELA